jgi:hypothetical protein
MVEMDAGRQWDEIRAEIRRPLALLVGRLQEGLGDNLQSVSVVGSSLTQDFESKVSDINTVVLLAVHDLPALGAVARLIPLLAPQKLSLPLLLTPFYLDRSRDVFPVEFLDFQLVHQTIFGPDPFSPMQFEKRYVRLQCERELKAMLVRLRQGYLAATGDKRMVRDLLIATAGALAPVLRALLWLVDANRPKTREATVHRAAGEFEVDLGIVPAIHTWRHRKLRLIDAEMESAFLALLDAVERLATIVDGLEVQKDRA